MAEGVQGYCGFLEMMAVVVLRSDELGLPLEIVAIAGEIIAIDARQRAYSGAKSKLKTVEEFENFLDGTDVLQSQVKAAIAQFSVSHDGAALERELNEIKRALASFC